LLLLVSKRCCCRQQPCSSNLRNTRVMRYSCPAADWLLSGRRSRRKRSPRMALFFQAGRLPIRLHSEPAPGQLMWPVASPRDWSGRPRFPIDAKCSVVSGSIDVMDANPIAVAQGSIVHRVHGPRKDLPCHFRRVPSPSTPSLPSCFRQLCWFCLRRRPLAPSHRHAHFCQAIHSHCIHAPPR
jgi:hypothetical protein